MTTKTLSLIASTLLLTINTFAEETLEDITVVSANKTSQSIKNTTSNVTVITAEDIEENGYQTVLEAINHSTGVITSSSGGLGQQSSFFLRGNSSDKVLVLIDGMRLNDPTTTAGQALIEHLTTFNIKQIEIVKGGMSTVWGANASAGVINIITKNASKGTHGSINIGYGSHKTKNTDIALSYSTEKFNAQFLGSYIKTAGISALAPKNSEKDGYVNKTYNVKLSYLLDENNKVKLAYNYIDAETEYDSSSPKNPNDETSMSDSKQKNLSLNYEFNLDNYTAIFQATKGDINRKLPFGIYDATITEYSLINIFNYTNGKVTLGLEYKDIDDGSTGAYINKGIYISNLYHISQSTLLETNVRYDQFDKFTNKFTYKIGLKHTHDFLDGFVTSANYYTSYNAPSAFQISNPYQHTSLKPSFSKGYEISASYKKLFTLSYFHNKVTDTLGYFGTYPNAGYANAKGSEIYTGIEVSTSYNYMNTYYSANYTRLIDYENIFKTDFDKRAKETLNMSIDYYTANDSHIGINTQYIGNRTEFGQSTGNYTVWNLNYTTQLIDNINFSLHAKNIFDKEYETTAGYSTEGRSIYMNLKYSF